MPKKRVVVGKIRGPTIPCNTKYQKTLVRQFKHPLKFCQFYGAMYVLAVSTSNSLTNQPPEAVFRHRLDPETGRGWLQVLSYTSPRVQEDNRQEVDQGKHQVHEDVLYHRNDDNHHHHNRFQDYAPI